MAVRVTERADGKIVEVIVTGTLHKADYEYFVPMLESAFERHGKLRMMLKMVEFQGWTMCAAWEDMKFDLKHFTDIERLALVGDKGWEQGMAVFCRPFTTATIRFFEFDQLDEAYSWVEEGIEVLNTQITSHGIANA